MALNVFSAIWRNCSRNSSRLGIADLLKNPPSRVIGWISAKNERVTDMHPQASESTLTTNLISEVTRATTAEGNKVAKAGDMMNGFLTLNADPTANLHAATKQYVDVENTRAQSAETSLTTTLNSEVTRATGAETLLSTNLNSEITRALLTEGLKIAKAGDTMTGPLTLVANPTINLHAATKQYVDSESTARVSANVALQTSINAKIDRAGDTMTGLLMLVSDPIASLHAATKQYVDQPKCRIKRITSGISVNSGPTQTAIPFNAVDYDTSAMTDITNKPTRIKCPKTGIYLISCCSTMTGTIGAEFRVALRVNGAASPVAEATGILVSSSYNTACLTTQLSLTVGDYVEIFTAQGSGSAQTAANPAVTHFCASRLP